MLSDSRSGKLFAASHNATGQIVTGIALRLRIAVGYLGNKVSNGASFNELHCRTSSTIH